MAVLLETLGLVALGAVREQDGQEHRIDEHHAAVAGGVREQAPAGGARGRGGWVSSDPLWRQDGGGRVGASYQDQAAVSSNT